MTAMTPPTLMGVNSLANSRVTTRVVSSAEVVRQRDGTVDVTRAAQDDAQVVVDALELLVFDGDVTPVFERARAIDDARQTGGQHAERDAHARDEEHRTQRELDEVGDVFGLKVDAGHGAGVCHKQPSPLNLWRNLRSHGLHDPHPHLLDCPRSWPRRSSAYQVKQVGGGRETISVKGLAEKPVRADRAEWTIRLQVQGATIAEALGKLRKERRRARCVPCRRRFREGGARRVQRVGRA